MIPEVIVGDLQIVKLVTEGQLTALRHTRRGTDDGERGRSEGGHREIRVRGSGTSAEWQGRLGR